MAVDTSSPATASTPPAGRGGRHRVVIIGSGFGGLWTAEALDNAPVAVTMISMTSHHLFQPLLYQVATGVLSEGEVAPATREVLKKQPNATVLLGRVTEIDLTERTVTSVSPLGTTVTPYDTLVVAAGAGQSYFGNDHFSEFAPGMKSIDDALELRGRIFGSFELAELCTDPAEAEEWLTFVVVDVDNTGVDVIDPDGTERRIRSRCKVWAAGVSASPLGQQLAEQSGAEVDRAGRVKVNPDLSLPGHPEVFVIGDMIALDNLPGVAQVAMQGGKHVAGQIKRRLAGGGDGEPVPGL